MVVVAPFRTDVSGTFVVVDTEDRSSSSAEDEVLPLLLLLALAVVPEEDDAECASSDELALLESTSDGVTVASCKMPA